VVNCTGTLRIVKAGTPSILPMQFQRGDVFAIDHSYRARLTLARGGFQNALGGVRGNCWFFRSLNEDFGWAHKGMIVKRVWIEEGLPPK